MIIECKCERLSFYATNERRKDGDEKFNYIAFGTWSCTLEALDNMIIIIIIIIFPFSSLTLALKGIKWVSVPILAVFTVKIIESENFLILNSICGGKKHFYIYKHKTQDILEQQICSMWWKNVNWIFNMMKFHLHVLRILKLWFFSTTRLLRLFSKNSAKRNFKGNETRSPSVELFVEGI